MQILRNWGGWPCLPYIGRVHVVLCWEACSEQRACGERQGGRHDHLSVFYCLVRTFVEIGKTDLHAKSAISLAPFDRHVTFAAADLGLMCLERPQQVSKLLSDVFARSRSNSAKPKTGSILDLQGL